MTGWTLVLFLHILGAIIWVGGQLTVTAVLLPPVSRLLTAPDRAAVLRAVGRRFALITAVVFLPLQIGTGISLAAHRGITVAALLHPGEGRVLMAKLVLFAIVMAAAAIHGVAQTRNQPVVARTASTAALTGSIGVVFLGSLLAWGAAAG